MKEKKPQSRGKDFEFESRGKDAPHNGSKKLVVTSDFMVGDSEDYKSEKYLYAYAYCTDIDDNDLYKIVFDAIADNDDDNDDVAPRYCRDNFYVVLDDLDYWS